MARIRSIKPEFWTSTQVMECTPVTRLMFIGLWNFCDDHGRHPASPKQLKALIFPSDTISVDDISRMLDELSSNALLRLYEIDGKTYFEITGWRHQKIDKRQAAKYPAPSHESSAAIVERSSNGIDGEDRKGRDRKGEDRKKDAAPSARSPNIRRTGDEIELFSRGKDILGEAAGGLIKNLLKAKGGSVPLARAAIETAATKQDPREWIGAVLRNGTGPPGSDYVDPRL